MTNLLGRQCTVDDPAWSDAYKREYAGLVFTVVAVAPIVNGWSVLLERDGQLSQFYPGQLRLIGWP